MKEIVVISGKGGTGKTSLTAALAAYIRDRAVIADCDVDAADMHLLLNPEPGKVEDFYSGKLAEINNEICSECGICKDKCRFNAIAIVNGNYSVNKINCEGCAYCAAVCPENAISMIDNKAGQLFISTSRFGATLVHARLGVAAENSGKLVAKVKSEAKHIAEKEAKEYILVDGSPGIGCPVVSSLSGADLVVFVSEPTRSALHDLERVNELVKKFGIDSACIINKYDLNRGIAVEIEKFLEEENITILERFPYDNSFPEAITQGLTIYETNNKQLAGKVEKTWGNIRKLTNKN